MLWQMLGVDAFTDLRQCAASNDPSNDPSNDQGSVKNSRV